MNSQSTVLSIYKNEALGRENIISPELGEIPTAHNPSFPSILLVNDDEAERSSVSNSLGLQGFSIVEVSSPVKARKTFSAHCFDVVLLAFNNTGEQKFALVSDLHALRPEIPIVVVMNQPDSLLSAEAIRGGADFLIAKPVNMEALEIVVRKSVQLGALRRRDRASWLYMPEEIFFGRSGVMRHAASLVKMAAESDTVVLLRGEPGTGQGDVARWIHEKSMGNETAFVKVNCSIAAPDLLRNELFGDSQNHSRSRRRHRGTLFLDHISDLDAQMQLELLRALENHAYQAVDNKYDHSNGFRLICSTNHNLWELVQSGRFRQDLFFRLNVLSIEIPPLRNCVSDLPALVQCLLSASGMPKTKVSREGMQLLLQYSWPGNIQELKIVVERALLLANGNSPLLPHHFSGIEHSPEGADGNPPYIGPRAPLDRVRDAFYRLNGDKKKMAESLGISRATLYRRLRLLR